MEPNAPSHPISLIHSKQRKIAYYKDVTFKRCYSIISGQDCGWKDVQLKHQPYIQVGRNLMRLTLPLLAHLHGWSRFEGSGYHPYLGYTMLKKPKRFITSSCIIVRSIQVTPLTFLLSITMLLQHCPTKLTLTTCSSPLVQLYRWKEDNFRQSIWDQTKVLWRTCWGTHWEPIENL
jgi:hypothetical protein